ncbi:hypothetical protein [Streptomyces sp. NPDC088766]|uniref:hypothetical protein n=1 Tax=Streptomyces sp. NPDC088766 TaxID=3365893 RepID=UPI0037F3D154
MPRRQPAGRDLLTRWSAECPAVRLALAGLAVVFPAERTLRALTPRLKTFLHQLGQMLSKAGAALTAPRAQQ